MTYTRSKEEAMEEDFDAIEAFHKWRDKKLSDICDDDNLICECMCISAFDIREFFKDSQKLDLKMLQDQLGLGQGCSSCVRDFINWKDKIF